MGTKNNPELWAQFDVERVSVELSSALHDEPFLGFGVIGTVRALGSGIHSKKEASEALRTSGWPQLLSVGTRIDFSLDTANKDSAGYLMVNDGRPVKHGTLQLPELTVAKIVAYRKDWRYFVLMLTDKAEMIAKASGMPRFTDVRFFTENWVPGRVEILEGRDLIAEEEAKANQ